MQAESAGIKWPMTWEANLLAAAVVLMVGVGAAIFAAAGLAWLLVIPQLFIAVPAAIWIAARRYPLAEVLRLRPITGRGALLSALIGVACWPVMATLGTLAERVLSRIGPGPEIPYPTNAVESVAYILALVVLAPLTEEPIFRGFVMSAWLRRGTIAGLLASALLFACVHLQIGGLLPIVLLGIVFGFLVLRSGSLLASIIAHAAYNALGAILIVSPSLHNLPDVPLFVAAAIALPIAVLLIWTFAQRFPARPADKAADRTGPLGLGASLLPALFILLLTFAGEIYLRFSPSFAP